jgi:nucleoside phosphorylase
VYAGVLAFNLGVTIAIGDRALALASGAVAAATLGAAALGLRARSGGVRVIVCAATETEAAACRRGVAASGIEGVEVLRTGVGAFRAGQTLARRLARERSRPLVVSAGFAGALGGGIEVGEVVTGHSVHALAPPGHPAAVLAPGLRSVPGVRPVHLVSADSVVIGGAGWRSGPAVVDMETAALAGAARAAGSPLAVLRVVTDTPAEPLPELARAAAAALASPAGLRRAALAGRTVAEALRAPRAALALARASRGWTRALEEAVRGRTAALAELAGPPTPS